ncbi:MAG: lytic transglycosylase domain-containing protein, partial [Treponema bryantii]|nr:lytic transglycosylase domain-containing protein [Treponema bryantii]
YRIQTYKRDYIFTFNNSERLLKYFEEKTLEPSAQLASDIGKSFLYGNSDVIPNAMYFSELAEKFKKTPMEFYFWFYAGRLFDKGSLYNTKTKNSFENAINCTDSVQLKDNAIWYLLNTSFTSDINLVLPLLQEYAALWNDPTYFDDFFDALSSAIFTTGDWQLFHQVFKTIENYASPSIVSQFAYLSARLIQTNHIKGTQDDMINCFKKAYTCNGSIYYQNLAKYQLIQNKVDIKSLDSEIKITTSSEPINYDAAILLEGYATFGFPEKIYKTWTSLDNKNIPQDKLIFLCEFLQKCGSYAEEDDYFTQSLRMAQKIEGQSKLKFPKNYTDLVEKYSKECEIDPTIIYSLIRSESFFDPDVSSMAGAIGLTQLMDFTANDIARKLKISEYSLTDPETNIQFGTYYLKNMISRLEDDYLHGFFAYNAGITRVRRWLNTSILGFGKKSNMPSDLFLETLPYTETREYGRKLVSASVMYKTLYSENPEKEFTEILELIMDF